MDSKWERVQPYIKLDIEIAERMMSFIKPHGKIEKISLIKKGLRNTNYCVEYDNSKFLLRIYDFNDNCWEKERSVFEHINGKIRVPELFYLNKESDIINKPYAIFEYVNGVTLDEYVNQEKYNKNVICEIGQNLALVHGTPYKDVGFFNNNLNIATKLPNLELWYDMFLTGNTVRKLGPKLVDEVKNYIEANHKNIKRIEERIAFVHNDFRPINIIVDNNDNPYFIDWEGSMAGHILGDIGQFLRIKEQINPEDEKLFISSYNYVSKNKLPDDYKELTKLRDLVNLLQLLNSKHDLQNKDRDLIALIRNTCCT